MSANPPTADDAIVAALSTLGPWGAIAGLAVKFGLPFVTKIIQNAENNTPVSAAEWQKTADLAHIPGETLVPQRPQMVPPGSGVGA